MADNELTVSNQPSGQLSETRLAQELGEMFAMPANSIVKLVRDQIIQVPRDGHPATPAELAFVMSVMRQYRLNPFIKQIHAWRDWQGRLAVMVGYDGWVQYAREQATYRGVSYEFGPVVPSPDGKGKNCWEWIRATVHDQARGDLVQVPVYLEEWYVKQRKDKPEPWQNQTKHRLHLKAFTSAIREVYGLGGVSDEVDRDVLNEAAHQAEYRMAEKVETMAAAMPGLAESVAAAESLSIRPEGEVVPPPPGFEPLEDCPCGVAGCPAMATAACGICGQYVCPAHMGADGFTCAGCGEGK